MARFKPGQEIICVDVSDFPKWGPIPLEKGKIYTVDFYENRGDTIDGSPLIVLKEDTEHHYRESRFEPLADITELKEILERVPEHA